MAGIKFSVLKGRADYGRQAVNEKRRLPRSLIPALWLAN